MLFNAFFDKPGFRDALLDYLGGVYDEIRDEATHDARPVSPGRASDGLTTGGRNSSTSVTSRFWCSTPAALDTKRKRPSSCAPRGAASHRLPVRLRERNRGMSRYESLSMSDRKGRLE